MMRTVAKSFSRPMSTTLIGEKSSTRKVVMSVVRGGFARNPESREQLERAVR